MPDSSFEANSPSGPSSPAPLDSISSRHEDDDISLFHNGNPAMSDEYHTRETNLQKVTLGLTNGNFVWENDVPAKLLSDCQYSDSQPHGEREFTHMRYSAATCDPDDFRRKGFTLRQAAYNPPRKTELFIVITMYNENDELFRRTMDGVIENIADLCARKEEQWGADGWKKVVVCIVADGRLKINHRTLNVITVMGAYQADIAQNKVGEDAVVAHICEYTTQARVGPSMEVEKAKVPVQIIFCLKEKNQKKLNSHRWFFNAFCPILDPSICILLDVGTVPSSKAFFHLWRTFDRNPHVGGACGEIVVRGGQGRNLINPLIAAQNFEYKMSNILDKPLESIFGYISVLPGAFSAYRFIALQNDDSERKGPLDKYFMGEKRALNTPQKEEISQREPDVNGGCLPRFFSVKKMRKREENIFDANMYLAEDRILCWEVVSKPGCAWTLHYVKSAKADTDVPDEVAEFISQRRRWLNGSFFATIHSIFKFYYIYRSKHSVARKLWIQIEMLYQLFNIVFSWFALGNFYISFRIFSEAMEDPSFHLGHAIHELNLVLNYIYLGLLLMCLILALGNRPHGSEWGYTIAMIGFAAITVYMTVAAFFLAFKGIDNLENATGSLTLSDLFTNSIFRNIVISILATTGLYILASLIFLDPWHMITSFVQYLLLAPSYFNVLNVYAFANVHDVSWGTKGDTSVSTDLGVVHPDMNTNTVEVAKKADLNAEYQKAKDELSKEPNKQKKKPDTQTALEDYYRNFRTQCVLLAWALSNGILAAVVVEATGSAASRGAHNTVNGYLAFILFSVAGLALIRFLGSTSYMLVRLFAGE